MREVIIIKRARKWYLYFRRHKHLNVIFPNNLKLNLLSLQYFLKSWRLDNRYNRVIALKLFIKQGVKYNTWEIYSEKVHNSQWSKEH
jgi:hypothetical protein